MELSEEHSERELEESLINNMKAFLEEMGGNFAFIGSQLLTFPNLFLVVDYIFLVQFPNIS